MLPTRLTWRIALAIVASMTATVILCLVIILISPNTASSIIGTIIIIAIISYSAYRFIQIILQPIQKLDILLGAPNYHIPISSHIDHLAETIKREHRLQTICSAIPIPFMLFNQDGRALFASPQMHHFAETYGDILKETFSGLAAFDIDTANAYDILPSRNAGTYYITIHEHEFTCQVVISALGPIGIWHDETLRLQPKKEKHDKLHSDHIQLQTNIKNDVDTLARLLTKYANGEFDTSNTLNKTSPLKKLDNLTKIILQAYATKVETAKLQAQEIITATDKAIHSQRELEEQLHNQKSALTSLHDAHNRAPSSQIAQKQKTIQIHANTQKIQEETTKLSEVIKTLNDHQRKNAHFIKKAAEMSAAIEKIAIQSNLLALNQAANTESNAPLKPQGLMVSELRALAQQITKISQECKKLTTVGKSYLSKTMNTQQHAEVLFTQLKSATEIFNQTTLITDTDHDKDQLEWDVRSETLTHLDNEITKNADLSIKLANRLSLIRAAANKIVQEDQVGTSHRSRHKLLASPFSTRKIEPIPHQQKQSSPHKEAPSKDDIHVKKNATKDTNRDIQNSKTQNAVAQTLTVHPSPPQSNITITDTSPKDETKQTDNVPSSPDDLFRKDEAPLKDKNSHMKDNANLNELSSAKKKDPHFSLTTDNVEKLKRLSKGLRSSNKETSPSKPHQQSK